MQRFRLRILKLLAPILRHLAWLRYRPGQERRSFRVKLDRCGPIGALGLIACYCCLAPLHLPAQEQDSASSQEDSATITPLVVMEKTRVTGRVMFIQDEKDGERPATNLKIELWTDNDKRRIYRTKTDKNGIYLLPETAVGAYRLYIGRLRLKLRIMPRSTFDEELLKEAKILMIFIPRELE